MGKQIQRGVRLLRCSVIICDHRPCSPHFERVETECPAPSRHSTHTLGKKDHCKALQQYVGRTQP